MNSWFVLAALNGAVAVAAGAFATHGLQSQLDAHVLDIFQTGARYQMFHALAMGLAALVPAGPAKAPATVAAGLFLTGSLLFSGSLYGLSLTGVRAFGLVTPFGGVAFIAGWIALMWAGMKLKS